MYPTFIHALTNMHSFQLVVATVTHFGVRIAYPAYH